MYVEQVKLWVCVSKTPCADSMHVHKKVAGCQATEHRAGWLKQLERAEGTFAPPIPSLATSCLVRHTTRACLRAKGASAATHQHHCVPRLVSAPAGVEDGVGEGDTEGVTSQLSTRKISARMLSK